MQTVENSTIPDIIYEIIASYVDHNEWFPCDSILSNLGIDSLKRLNLVYDVEQQLEIEEIHEADYQQWLTVQDVINYTIKVQNDKSTT